MTLVLSQVIFGVGDLERAADRFRGLGFEVLDGGVHPGVGTANRVIPLGEQYLELLGVVDHDLAQESDYGRSLVGAIAGGDRLVRWSLRTDAIDEVAVRLGLEPQARRRVRPDGELLTWQAAGLELSLADATLPFFMQWDRAEQYPGALSASHPNGATRVSSLSVVPHDADRFAQFTAGAEVPLRIDRTQSPGLSSVGVETDAGELVIR